MNPLPEMHEQYTYVLVTAVKNEALYIGQTIASVLSQSILPRQWVIVSDGSTDGTDELVINSIKECDFIKFVSLRHEDTRGFGSKVRAINQGYEAIQKTSFDFIGNLDGDISFHNDYYQQILEIFNNDPKMGIAGGYIYEETKGIFRSRPSNSESSVAGAIQLFRRSLYDDIGGHHAIDIGGEDWCLEILARMRGWTVRSFPHVPVYHLKSKANLKESIRRNYTEGRKDFAFGSHPIFELFKCLRRINERPCLLGASMRLVGFVIAALMREHAVIPKDMSAYLRKEQSRRIQRYTKWRAF